SLSHPVTQYSVVELDALCMRRVTVPIGTHPTAPPDPLLPFVPPVPPRESVPPEPTLPPEPPLSPEPPLPSEPPALPLPDPTEKLSPLHDAQTTHNQKVKTSLSRFMSITQFDMFRRPSHRPPSCPHPSRLVSVDGPVAPRSSLGDLEEISAQEASS